MKKRIKMILAAALSLSMLLGGCAGGNKTNEAPAATEKQSAEAPAAEEKKDNKIVVGVSLLTREHVFYNNIEKALKEKADELGIELIVQDASTDANKQLSQVQDFITSGVDAIIMSPTNSAGSKSMVELAGKENIPVFTMDVSSDGDTVSHVATDNKKGGELAAEYVGKNILKEGKGEVAIVTYSEVESCVNREKGFIEYLAANYPDIKVVDVQNSSGDQAKAANVTQDMLLKHPNLKVIFGVGDPFALGALSSIKAANMDVKIVGFDGNPESIEEIKKGENWVAEIAQNPDEIGKVTLQTVKDYLDGKQVEKVIPIAPKVLDINNLE